MTIEEARRYLLLKYGTSGIDYHNFVKEWAFLHQPLLGSIILYDKCNDLYYVIPKVE